MHITYLALGTNLGDKKALMTGAIQRINRKVGTVLCQSSFYETEPWGFESPNLFLNACIKVSTSLSPQQLLKETQNIEKEMGRERKSCDGVYHDRTMDIDILLYDQLEISERNLTIPHPKMYERDFVMKPLREIYPGI